MESESLPSLTSAPAYELRSRVPEIEAPYAVLDDNALERIKRRIAKHLRKSGVLILHDIAVPATSTTIDHLCIGPNGITAIDVERTPKGDDREAVIRRVSRETEILAAILTEAGIESERISGAVCETGRWAARGSTEDGITVGDPRQVAKVARSDRGGRPLDVQLALAVVRNRLGREGQRSYSITRPEKGARPYVG